MTARPFLKLLAFFLSVGFCTAQNPSAVANVTVARPGPCVRVTLPMAPGTPFGATCPFELSDGAPIATQWELVASWPDGTVRVAELLVRDETPSSSYAVMRADQQRGRTRPVGFARAWLVDPPAILLDGFAVQMAWGGAPRDGTVCSTRRFHGARLFGFVTVWTGSDLVEFDLVLHNAEPAQPDLFFDRVEVAGVPDAAFAWPQPGASADGALHLVSPRADGKLHGLVQRGAHWWSAVLHDGTQDAAARAHADGAGWGVCDAWRRVDAWGAAALRLPDLSYRASALASSLRIEWAGFSAALSAGTPVGMVAGGVGRADWQHPFNPKDGGTTGGGYRHQWHGVECAATGEPAGVSVYRARLACIMDRDAVSALQPNGQPLPYETMLDAAGKPIGGWRTSSADARFDGTSDGAYGWSVRWSQNAGPRTPPELALFKQPIAGGGISGAFEPIDFQHWDRSLQDAEALVWLTNSPVAAWWVRVNSETWRASLFSAGRLAGEVSKARSRPAWGTGWGRAAAHGARFAAVAYALGDAQWRARWGACVASSADVLVTAQQPNGCWKRDEVSKAVASSPFLGKYALTKGTEEAMLAHAALGLARSAGQRTGELVAAVDRWTRDALWRYLWHSGAAGSAPTDYIAIALKGGVPFTDPAMPLRLNADREEVASPLGCAMLLRRIAGQPFAPEQIAAAQRWCGGSAAPLTWLRAQSAYALKLDDCAPLHAALEMQ